MSSTRESRLLNLNLCDAPDIPNMTAPTDISLVLPINYPAQSLQNQSYVMNMFAWISTMIPKCHLYEAYISFKAISIDALALKVQYSPAFQTSHFYTHSDIQPARTHLHTSDLKKL